VKTLVDDIKFLGYTCTHPFNGFYDLRFRRNRNWPLIVFIFLMVGVVQLLTALYSGILAGGAGGGAWMTINPVFFIVTTLFPFLLFAISNWAVTNIFDGNGKMGDIFMVLAYALVPRIIFDIVFIIVSNIVTQPEMFMLNAIDAVGWIIFVFLTFCGLCVVHEYSPAKNIVTLLATAAAAVLIIFVGAVYLILMSRLIGMITTVFLEISRRGVVF